MGFLGWLERRSSGRSAEAIANQMLHERIAGLERALEKLHEKQAGHHITIQNLHVHNPALEQLLFRLDRLDIDELSGALNLGNNFGTRVGKKDSAPKPAAPTGPAEKPAGTGGMVKTPAGFKFETGAKAHRQEGGRQ